MANYTQGDTRPVLQATDLATYQGNGSLVLDSRRTRPLWFDGRFLAARDLEREQDYFLLREADLGRAPGFGVIRGLLVDTPPSTGQASDSDTIIIRAGHGITPAGELVTIPNDLTLQISDLVEEASLDAQFGISTAPPPVAATRTGLYVVALRPVQFTANPISAYPLSVQGSRSTRDGDIVEATAISLVPYPTPPNNSDATTLHAALARQVFLTGNPGQLSDSLLPLTLVSLQSGAIDWLDPWLVRRETGPQFSGLHFGLTDPPTQQAFLQQYDSQLQQIVATFVQQKLPARFAAASYFQALPPAGRFPLACISTDGFTQLFFPQQIDLRLSVVPEDELPALLADSLSLPPIDLTLSPSAYTNLTIFALIPVPRQGYTSLAAGLPSVPPTTILPQVLNNRRPIDLLRFYQGNTGITQPSPTANSSWQTAIGNQTYGYYLRRRSSAPSVVFMTPPTLTSLSPSSVTAGGPALTITINGAGFNNATALSWTLLQTPAGTPTPLFPNFVDSGQLTVTIPASFTSQVGAAAIMASNGSVNSNALDFTITPMPLGVTSVSPSRAVAGGPAFTLTVNGSGFTALASVTWNGTSLPTTFVSGTQLTAAVPASLIASAGSANVSVELTDEASPAPLPFAIVPLAITSISPTSATSGISGLSLTVTGTGFGSILYVLWNGNAFSPNITEPGQLTAEIPAAFLFNPGSFTVNVQSDGLVSNTLPFTLNPPPLVLNSLSPNTIVVGGPIFTLTLNGSGFSSTTVVTWNVNKLAVTSVSATQISVSVPASLIATDGSASVSVSGPNQTAPPALSFTITPSFFLTQVMPPSISLAPTGVAPNLTVTGGGFDATTLLFVNAAQLPTTLVSATQMTAFVPLSVLPGSATSVSMTAHKGTLVTNALTVPLVPGPSIVVTLGSLSPTYAVAGSKDITLLVNGSLFTANNVVTWNGTALASKLVSSTQLSAVVPAALLAAVGTASVNVNLQPQPVPLTFTITKPLVIIPPPSVVIVDPLKPSEAAQQPVTPEPAPTAPAPATPAPDVIVDPAKPSDAAQQPVTPEPMPATPTPTKPAPKKTKPTTTPKPKAG